MAQGLIVSPAPAMRFSAAAVVSGIPTAVITVAGGGTAGAKKIITLGNASEALSEMTRLDLPVGAHTVRLIKEQSHGSEAFSVRLAVAYDDIDAANVLASGLQDCRTLSASESRIDVTVQGVQSVYVVAIATIGSTPANQSGRIYVEIDANV